VEKAGRWGGGNIVNAEDGTRYEVETLEARDFLLFFQWGVVLAVPHPRRNPRIMVSLSSAKHFYVFASVL
jgi:hypothetical protein